MDDEYIDEKIRRLLELRPLGRIQVIHEIIHEAAHRQAVACCKAVCDMCRCGFLYKDGYHDNTIGAFLLCDAKAIRAAWLRDHGTPLEIR